METQALIKFGNVYKYADKDSDVKILGLTALGFDVDESILNPKPLEWGYMPSVLKPKQ